MLAEYKIDTVVEVILQTYHIICLRDNEQLWIASTIHDHGKCCIITKTLLRNFLGRVFCSL